MPRMFEQSPLRRRSLRFRFLVAVAAGSLCGLWACNSGQTGGEVRDNGFGQPGTGTPSWPGGGDDRFGESAFCEEGDSHALELDDSSALGFSASDVLEFAGGHHEAPLLWQVQVPSSVVVTPAAGDSRIELTVRYEGGAIARLERRPREGQGEGLAIDIAGSEDGCADVLTIEVQVDVQTANGAFDDTFEATLRATRSKLASLYIPFQPAELSGTFDVDVRQLEGAEATQFHFFADFHAAGFAGTISGGIEQSTADVASQIGVVYGRWPDAECQWGELPVAADHPLAEAAWAQLALDAPLRLTWQDASAESSELELSLSLEGSHACHGLDSTSVLRFEVAAEATSSDGRIAGTWDLEAQVELDADEAPAGVRLLRQAWLAKGVPTAQFEAASGISGVDLQAYPEATFSFDLRYPTAAEPGFTGRLEVLGMTPADCPPPDPTPGTASPGCAGTDSTLVVSASLSSLD